MAGPTFHILTWTLTAASMMMTMVLINPCVSLKDDPNSASPSTRTGQNATGGKTKTLYKQLNDFSWVMKEERSQY